MTRIFGSGVQIAYDDGDDVYTVTVPGEGTVEFLDPTHGVSSTPVTYDNGFTRMLLFIPEIDGVALSYTFLGMLPGGVDLFTGGIPTLASDIPTVGTATYTMAIGGTAKGVNLLGSGASGTFVANFAAGTLSTSMVLSGTNPAGGAAFDFGTLTGTGALDSGGPGFSGSLTHSASPGNGIFSGAFFGPAAAEFGYGWVFAGDTFFGAGLNAGKKD